LNNTWESVAKKYESIYQELLKEKAKNSIIFSE